jgi:hypothetical protein
MERGNVCLMKLSCTCLLHVLLELLDPASVSQLCALVGATTPSFGVAHPLWQVARGENT